MIHQFLNPQNIDSNCLNSASGGSNRSNADVSESDCSIRKQSLHILRSARSSGAWTTRNSRVGCGLIKGKVGIEPKHRSIVVVPKRKNKDHSSFHGLAHLNQATLLLVVVNVSKKIFGSIAHFVSDGVVVGQTGPSCLGSFDPPAVLDVEASNLFKVSVGCAIGGDELSDDSERKICVDLKVGSVSVKGLLSHSVGCKVAAIFVTNALVPKQEKL